MIKITKALFTVQLWAYTVTIHSQSSLASILVCFQH